MKTKLLRKLRKEAIRECIVSKKMEVSDVNLNLFLAYHIVENGKSVGFVKDANQANEICNKRRLCLVVNACFKRRENEKKKLTPLRFISAKKNKSHLMRNKSSINK